MSKNIVVCCDGTGNEIEANLSNVLKLFRALRKGPEQLVFYDPGIGTLGRSSAWSRFRNNVKGVFGLATGYGLDDNILDAYRFLAGSYDDGDRIYMFGFSRGAYTVRALGGFLRLVGLLAPAQENLFDYALTAYKRAAAESNLEIAWRFQRVSGARHVPIKFLGVWDTVSSVLVPRPDRFFVPSLQMLPYTARNELVEVFRHASAIDERRAMFRLNRWKEPQEHKPDLFGSGKPQDIKQVWFAGVHSDVGGGYPEDESGLAKFPLKWLIDEAEKHGILINRTLYNHLVLGQAREGGSRQYVPPDPAGTAHNSMTWGWRPLELIPKRAKFRDWPRRPSFLGLYLPLCEPRRIDERAVIHQSVIERMEKIPGYKPVNLPSTYTVEP